MKKYSEFLKDVLICSLGAYGGPEAHYGVFIDQLVIKKKYLTEDEMLELIALTGILPGPSSTQSIIAIGHKVGGPILGFLTMVVWAIPAIMIMTLLSFMYGFFENRNIFLDYLDYIGPMAIGFILLAVYRIGKKVITDKLTLFLFLFSLVITYFIRKPFIFPLVLIVGGLGKVLTSKEENLWERKKINPPWRYFIAFLIFALGGIILKEVIGARLLVLFESFYRFGYLVIGGGQVVVPLMHTELVEVNDFMTSQEFLTGFGLAQGVPGPMFSFSAYAGGMATRGGSVVYQILGALTSGLGIFLPGVLLIFFVYPIWEDLKKIRGIKVSLSGITAAAGGLLASAGLDLLSKTEITFENIFILVITMILLKTKKVPAPLIVLGVLVFGYFF